MRYSRVVLLLALAIGFLSGCEVVRPGYAGIKVNNYGSSRGVEDYPVQVGRVFYNPISEDIYKYPTFVQTVRYDGEQHSLTFASSEGSALNVDVGISYSFVADKVPHVFVKYRQDPEHIEQTILRNNVRDALNRHASAMKAVDIVGAGKQALLDSVKIDLQNHLGPDGFHFENVSWLSEVRPLDARVTQSINATIQATQAAIAAENKVRQSKAEAEQAAAVAEGTAQAARISAKGEADAIKLKVDAQAAANKNLAQSLTPELIEYERVRHWNGALPQFTGNGVIPMYNVAPK